uniref:Uncharacterized protein n=1 Tax=Klebsiella phage HenuGS TaxID=3350566 RepID=A0AB74UQ69_9CAUD
MSVQVNPSSTQSVTLPFEGMAAGTSCDSLSESAQASRTCQRVSRTPSTVTKTHTATLISTLPLVAKLSGQRTVQR